MKWLPYIVVGACVGIVCGVIIVLYRRSQRKLISIRPLSELLEEQVVCSILTSDTVADWVEACQKDFRQIKLAYLFGRVNQQMLPMFTSDRLLPAQIDGNSHYFVCAVSQTQKLPVRAQLFNCTQLEDTLQELLGDKDYGTITDTD